MRRTLIGLLMVALLVPMASLNMGCDDTRIADFKSGLMEVIFGNLALGIQTIVTEVTDNAVDEVLDFLDIDGAQP